MATNTTYKRSTSTVTLEVGLSEQLAVGQTVDSITSITGSPSGLTIGTGTLIDSDTGVRFNASGGTDGVSYAITILFERSDLVAKTAIVYLQVSDEVEDTSSPFKPASWKLEVGRRYLRGWIRELSEDDRDGVTLHEIAAAEDYAWNIMLTQLINYYDVSGWDTNPPKPLFEIWDLLSSAYLLDQTGNEISADEEKLNSMITRWFNRAFEMLGNITDPQHERFRVALIRDGSIVHKRSNVSMPVVVNFQGGIFFPRLKSTTFNGRNLGNSVEGFVEDHSENSF